VNATLARSLAIALGAAACSNCALLTPANVEARKEALTAIPATIPDGKMHPGTLLVLALQTNAIYDTTQIAYKSRPYEVAYFSRTEWAEKPAAMIQALVVQTLQRSKEFSAVVMPPFAGHTTHTLRLELRALDQDFASEPASAKLDLRVQLTAEETGQIIASKEIRISEPMQEKTPDAGVVAANTATAKALSELAEFVRAAMD
jgi:cholesterol transport system auxiliary component